VRFADFRAAVADAEELWRGGSGLQAKRAYSELVSRRLEELGYQAAALTEADLLVIERLADLAVPFGEVDAADDLLATLERAYRQRGPAWRADQAAIKRLHLALGAGRLHDAVGLLRGLGESLGPIEDLGTSDVELARFEAASPWPPETRPALLAQLYLELGQMLAALGQHRGALALLARGRRHCEGAAAPAPARLAAAPLRLCVAATLLQQGELGAAAAELAVLSSGAAGVRDEVWAVRRRELSARLLALRGEWPEAVAELEGIMAICLGRGLARSWAWAAANLAGIRLLLNQLAGAEELLAAAGAQARASGDRALAWWVERRRELIRDRGGLLLDKDPAMAVSQLQEAGERTAAVGRGLAAGAEADAAAAAHAADIAAPESDPALRPGDGLTYFDMRALELQTWLARRQLGRAADCLDALRTDFARWDSRLVQLRLGLLASTVEYYQGVAAAAGGGKGDACFLRAEAGLVRARTELQELGLRPELYETQRKLGWCWCALGRPAAQRDALVTENQRLLDAMAQPLAADQRAAFLANKWSAGEQAMAASIGALIKVRESTRGGGVLGRARRRVETWWRLGALLDRIYSLKDELAGAAGASPRRPARSRGRAKRSLRLAWRLMTCPRRHATLAFLVLPNLTLTIRLGWLSLDFAVAPMTRLQVRELVREWHRQIIGLAGSAGLDGSAARRVAAAIGDRLEMPRQLAKLSGRVRELTIVPDDCLHGFPFAALPHVGGYLVERYALTTAFQVLSRPATSRRRGVGRGRGEALVVGVDKSVGEFPALPDGARQLRWIGKLLARRGIAVETLRNEAAGKEVLLARLQRAAFWHMSCHGEFHPDCPDATGLVLLPRAREERELLSLRELAVLPLDRLRQVVLASCWAADNYLLPGRWVVSLPEVLWRAGAASILGCLWEVDDRSVGRLNRRFYAGLERLPRNQALRRAQLQLLHRPETAHPLFWAGYQLYGDSGLLRP
jgi:hypothetical protein